MNKILRAFLDGLNDIPGFSGTQLIGPNTSDVFGNNPLHVAAIQDNVDVMQILIDVGVDINKQGEHGYTPLHEAVEQNNIEAVQALLRLGADTTVKNDHKMRAEEICDVEGIDLMEIAKLFK